MTIGEYLRRKRRIESGFKQATLQVLQQWDDPEVRLNPRLDTMVETVGWHVQIAATELTKLLNEYERKNL